jgi:hypothetical protein
MPVASKPGMSGFMGVAGQHREVLDDGTDVSSLADRELLKLAANKAIAALFESNSAKMAAERADAKVTILSSDVAALGRRVGTTEESNASLTLNVNRTIDDAVKSGMNKYELALYEKREKRRDVMLGILYTALAGSAVTEVIRLIQAHHW